MFLCKGTLELSQTSKITFFQNSILDAFVQNTSVRLIVFLY